MTTPDVLGMAPAKAVNLLFDAGLRPAVIGIQPDATPPSSVVAQQPAPGSLVARGSAVEITESAGPSTIHTS